MFHMTHLLGRNLVFSFVEVFILPQYKNPLLLSAIVNRIMLVFVR